MADFQARPYFEELWDAACPHWRSDPPKIIGLEPERCSYLTDRFWNLKMIAHQEIDRLMLLGGQRFGYAYCVTDCVGCRACVPARIKVAGFPFSRSQRRTLRKNSDLKVSVERVSYTPEKYRLLRSFVATKFDSRADWVVSELDRYRYYMTFHMYNPAHSREVHYREGDRLLGVSIVDLGARGIYSHYFFYDLEAGRRRLGIYSFLREILWCQELGFPYLYIGFLNELTPALSYKSQFSQLEVLRPKLGWISYR